METAETLKEKIDLLGLSGDEETKLKEKFMASLAFVTSEEEKDVIDTLKSRGNNITRAREVKVVDNPVTKIEKNYSFMEDAKATDIYDEDLNYLSRNGVDIYKRVKYFDQSGIPRKNEDGTYRQSVFNDALFQKEVNGPTPTIETPIEDIPLEETEPIDITVPEVEIPKDELEVKEEGHEEVPDYMQAEADINDIESQTTTFAQIKQDLEAQLAELDALRNQSEYENNDNVYRFNDIEQETYDVGRGR